jgi:hypothetical protein
VLLMRFFIFYPSKPAQQLLSSPSHIDPVPSSLFHQARYRTPAVT